MNVTREQMIEILNTLAAELEAGRGEKWKAATATGDTSYSVKLEVLGIALPADQWPMPPAPPEPPEPDLFDKVPELESITRTGADGVERTVSRGQRGGKKSH